MTIIEALKSGKPFKRKIGKYWYKPNDTAVFTPIEVLAEDWEIQEPREFWLVRSSTAYPWNVTSNTDIWPSTHEFIKVREVIE